MIRLSNVAIPLDYTQSLLVKISEKALKVRDRVERVSIVKKSVDARDKSDVHFVMALDVQVRGNENDLIRTAPRDMSARIEKPVKSCEITEKARFEARPLVVGMGPAGLAAAWLLAREG